MMHRSARNLEGEVEPGWSAGGPGLGLFLAIPEESSGPLIAQASSPTPGRSRGATTDPSLTPTVSVRSAHPPEAIRCFWPVSRRLKSPRLCPPAASELR